MLEFYTADIDFLLTELKAWTMNHHVMYLSKRANFAQILHSIPQFQHEFVN